MLAGFFLLRGMKGVHLGGGDDAILIGVALREHLSCTGCVLGARDLSVTIGVHFLEVLVRIRAGEGGGQETLTVNVTMTEVPFGEVS